MLMGLVRVEDVVEGELVIWLGYFLAADRFRRVLNDY
jgi:hypothetical protein